MELTSLFELIFAPAILEDVYALLVLITVAYAMRIRVRTRHIESKKATHGPFQGECEDIIDSSKSSNNHTTRILAEPKECLPETHDASSDFRGGFSRTRRDLLARFIGLFKGQIDENSALFTELEEVLISTDMGIKVSTELVNALRSRSGSEPLGMQRSIDLLKQELCKIMGTDPGPIQPERQGDLPFVLLVVGVNGSGKTTTIGKLAFQFSMQGKRVLLAACDTFRAAAREQLEEWARRSGADLEGAVEDKEKPSTVAFRALSRSCQENYDVLIIDTAGRLHNRQNLMNELEAVTRLISREIPGAPHETLLVLDGSSGQNALHQAREFQQKAGVTSIAITKLDGTPKGGIVVAIKSELGIPVRYVGIGEGKMDLKPFVSPDFVDALFES